MNPLEEMTTKCNVHVEPGSKSARAKCFTAMVLGIAILLAFIIFGAVELEKLIVGKIREEGRLRCSQTDIHGLYAYEARFNLCYRVEHITLMTGQNARNVCLSEGAHLVTIRNEEMFEFITQLVTFDSRVRRYFIDGMDHIEEGVWRAFNGDVLPWMTWGTVEPNGNISQNCLDIAYGHQKMADIGCSDPRIGGFICQQEV